MSRVEIPKKIFLDRLGGDEVYGFGQDGDVTITANTTLNRDMYYNDLTINANCDLDTNGYRVFVKGTLKASNLNIIGEFTTIDTKNYQTENLLIDNNDADGPSLKINHRGINNILEIIINNLCSGSRLKFCFLNTAIDYG